DTDESGNVGRCPEQARVPGYAAHRVRVLVVDLAAKALASPLGVFFGRRALLGRPPAELVGSRFDDATDAHAHGGTEAPAGRPRPYERTSAVVASLVRDARSKSDAAVHGASGPALGSGHSVPAAYVSTAPRRSTRTTAAVQSDPMASSTMRFAGAATSVTRSRACPRRC